MEQEQLSALVDYSQRSIPQPEKLKTIFKTNRELIERFVKEPVTIPDEQKLEEVAQWMADYKKRLPNSSKRQIRKAAQEYFNIIVFRKPYKTEKNATN